MAVTQRSSGVSPAQNDIPVTMQGIAVPAASVNPQEFFRRTRRLTFAQKTFSFAGMGLTDNVPILQTGIIAGLTIRVSGSVIVALPTGTCASTARWPYDLLKKVRVSANGQSNLINVSGAKLKVRDLMARGDLNDRGVTQGIGGASPGTSRNQGTLALANESWGVGQNVTAIPAATYNYDLEYYVPLAFDQLHLLGAIFAQTASTDLNLAIDWANVADLFTLTGTATATVSASVVVEAQVFSIPQGPNGNIVVPDLSMFHSLIETRYSALVNGDNEMRLAGQGVGRQLLRVYWQIWNGTPPAPLAVNATNYGQVGWRYGGNDTPELWTDGQQLAYWNERLFSSAIGQFAGVGCWDFSSENAFRDSVDLGAATETRLLLNIPAGVTLTSPAAEYVQESAFVGAVGA